MIDAEEWKEHGGRFMVILTVILILSLITLPAVVGAQDTEQGNTGSTEGVNPDTSSAVAPDNQTLLSQGVPAGEEGGTCSTCAGTAGQELNMISPQSMAVQSAVADTGNPSDWDVAVRFDNAPGQFYPFSPSPGIVGTTYYAKLTATDNNLKYSPYCFSTCGWDTCSWAKLARQPCILDLGNPCSLSLPPDNKGCFCWMGVPSAARVIGWYVERKYVSQSRSEIIIRGQAAGRANPMGEILVNPANHWKISQVSSCGVQSDQSNPPRATYCTSDDTTVHFAGAGDCGGSCACEDSGGLNIDLIVEQGVTAKPVLVGTEIINTWDAYFQENQNKQDFQTMEVAYIQSLLGAEEKPALDVLTIANFMNGETISRVDQGILVFLKDDLFPMQKDPSNPNRYRARDSSFNPVPFVKLFMSLGLPGTGVETPPSDTIYPDVIWTRVVVKDQFGNSYEFPVNQRLPTVIDARNKLMENCPVIPKSSCLGLQGNHRFITWEAAQGSDRIDALIIDPSGRKLGTLKIGDQYSLVNEIPGSMILPDVVFDQAKVVFGIAYIPDPEDGNYGVIIIGKEAADYKVQNLHWKGGSIVQNDIISGHVETGQIKGDFFKKAKVAISPDTITLNGKRKWVTATIEIPGYDVRNIDIGSIKLDGVVSPVKRPGNRGVPYKEISDTDQNSKSIAMKTIISSVNLW